MNRRRSIRVQGFDCRQPGACFVTIVTQGRLNLFGEIVEHDMRTNAAGEMVRGIWGSLHDRFPTIEPGRFIVMPDHLHGMLIIHADIGRP